MTEYRLNFLGRYIQSYTGRDKTTLLSPPVNYILPILKV